MSTYNDFSIVSVFPDISNKRIVIETNFKPDPTTVDLNTVKFYDYDKSSLCAYSLKCEGKNIIVQLFDYPICNERYYLHVVKVKDALGRILKTQYNDYIVFTNDVKTKVDIVEPASRVTYNSRVIKLKLNIQDEGEQSLSYRIEISPDISFFKKIESIVCNEKTQEVSGEVVSAQDIVFNKNAVDMNITIEREGQLFIRARAELSEDIVGDWSEVISFNIHTIPMDSIETTFLEEYLTAYDLFDEETLIETEIKERSEIGTNEGMFYLEFNKNIKIPEELLDSINEDGYISLGIVSGLGKELK